MPKVLKGPPYRWLSEPRWYLWEGGFLLIARAEGVIPPHAHHAVQITIALDGAVAICGEDQRWRHAPGIIVQPDIVHSFDCNAAMGAMLFVDPESTAGTWLRRALQHDITVVPDVRLASSITELRTLLENPIEAMEIGALVRHCVNALSPGAPPAHRLDDRIATVLHAIRTRDDLRMSLDGASQLAFLSPSRFAHLFKDQVGLPFSRYMLWRKMTRAMVAIASERNPRRRGPGSRLRRRRSSDTHLLPDGRHGAVRAHARPVYRNSLTILRHRRRCSRGRAEHDRRIADPFSENSRFIQSRIAG